MLPYSNTDSTGAYARRRAGASLTSPSGYRSPDGDSLRLRGPPRVTTRRVLALIGVTAVVFFFIRATSRPEPGLECIDTTGTDLNRPLTHDALFVHPGSRLKYLPFHPASNVPQHALKSKFTGGSSGSGSGVGSTIGGGGIIQEGDPLPTHCLDAHYTHGEKCHRTSETSPGPTKLDFVWTWVNSSDPLIRHTINSMAYDLKHDPHLGRPFQGDLKPNEYRDHDELRHSLRSVLSNYIPPRFSTPQYTNFHLLVSDVPVSPCSSSSSFSSSKFPNSKNAAPQLRLAQMPQWLDEANTGRWRTMTINPKTGKKSSAKLNLWYHQQVFEEGLYEGSVFHSYAIETQLHKIPSLSEHYVYLNDDFFFLSSLRTSDFYTNAYGPVLRLQPNLLVPPHRDGLYASGEWQALQHTNGLLSDRFAARYRPYAVHQSRTFTRAIVSEISLLWADDIALTAKRPFRGMSGGPGGGAGEVYVGFLYGGYLIERYREHLLWTWLVGKISTSVPSANDKWSLAHARAAWSDLGGALTDTLGKAKEDDVLKIARLDGQKERRVTLDPERVGKVVSDEEGILVRVGKGVQGMKTRYMFSSDDGYPLLNFGRRGTPTWEPEEYDGPSGKGIYDPWANCQIRFRDCFAPSPDGPKGDKEYDEEATVEGAFKRIAFERGVACGDCIITALVARSGPLGLSAFFPPAGTTYRPSSSVRTHSPHKELRNHNIPMLPLTKDWWQTDFSLDGVLGPYAGRKEEDGSVDVREWSMRALQRYRYVIGETPSKFASLKNPTSARRTLSELPLRETPDSIALLCLNDDIGYDDGSVTAMMKEWMEGQWRGKAGWEA